MSKLRGGRLLWVAVAAPVLVAGATGPDQPNTPFALGGVDAKLLAGFRPAQR